MERGGEALACFTCPTNFGATDDDDDEQNYRGEAFILAKVNQAVPIASLEALNRLFYKMNLQQFNNFGVPNGEVKDPFQYQCAIKHLHLSSDYKHLVQSHPSCSMKIAFWHKNCTQCFSSFSERFEGLNFEAIREIESYTSNPLDRLAYFPNFVEWAGLKYFVVLGKAESQRRVPIDFAKFLKPFQREVWICLGVALLSVNLILIGAEGAELRIALKPKWTLWLIADLFEQGGESGKGKNAFILVAWMVATFLLRNFYCFSMYTDLTAPATPLNLEDSNVELMESGNPVYIPETDRVKNLLSRSGLSSDIISSNCTDQGFLRKLEKKLHTPRGFCADNSEHTYLPDLTYDFHRILDSYSWYSKDGKCASRNRLGIAYMTTSRKDFDHLHIFTTTDRTLYKPLNEPMILPQLWIWKTGRILFYHEEIKRVLASIYESGITSIIRKFLERLERMDRLKRHVDWFKIYPEKLRFHGVMGMYEDLSRKEMMKGIALINSTLEMEDIDRDYSARLDEFQLILTAHFALSVGCIFIHFVEIGWSKCKEHGKRSMHCIM